MSLPTGSRTTSVSNASSSKRSSVLKTKRALSRCPGRCLGYRGDFALSSHSPIATTTLNRASRNTQNECTTGASRKTTRSPMMSSARRIVSRRVCADRVLGRDMVFAVQPIAVEIRLSAEVEDSLR